MMVVIDDIVILLVIGGVCDVGRTRMEIKTNACFGNGAR